MIPAVKLYWGGRQYHRLAYTIKMDSIHWFVKCLLSTYYVQGTVLDAGHTPVYKCKST